MFSEIKRQETENLETLIQYDSKWPYKWDEIKAQTNAIISKLTNEYWTEKENILKKCAIEVGYNDFEKLLSQYMSWNEANLLNEPSYILDNVNAYPQRNLREAAIDIGIVNFTQAHACAKAVNNKYLELNKEIKIKEQTKETQALLCAMVKKEFHNRIEKAIMERKIAEELSRNKELSDQLSEANSKLDMSSFISKIEHTSNVSIDKNAMSNKKNTRTDSTTIDLICIAKELEKTEKNKTEELEIPSNLIMLSTEGKRLQNKTIERTPTPFPDNMDTPANKSCCNIF